MKAVRIKILFMIFLFSAAVPSATQAMGSEALKAVSSIAKWTGSNVKNCCNYLKKPSNTAVVAIWSLFSYFAWQNSKKIWNGYKLSNEMSGCGRELLAKVDTGELIEDPLDGKYCFTLPDQSLLEKVHNALRCLDIEDFFIKKILILGKKCKEGDPNKKYFLGETKFTDESCLPYAILIDNQLLAKGSSIGQEFIYLREGGHVKARCLGGWSLDGELGEVTADIFALDALIKQKKKDELPSLSQDVFIGTRPRPYLSLRELVYYGEKIFDIQQRGDKLDFLSYAQKIVADREKDGYKQKIVEKTNCYFALSDGTRNKVDRLEKVADDWERELLEKAAVKRADDCKRELLAKINTGKLLKNDGRPYRLTSLNPEVVEKVHKSLDLLKIPKSVAEKILILGMEYEDYPEGEEITRAEVSGIYINETHAIPYAIKIDTKFLKEASSLVQEHHFDHEAGHIKAYCEGYLVGDKDQNELVADIYALNSFISRRKKKDQLFDLVSDPYMVTKSSMTTQPKGPYLSPQEWVYYEEKLSDIQRRGQKLNVLTYMRKIVADREKSDYEEQVERRATELGFTTANHTKFSTQHKDDDREEIVDLSRL